METKTKAMEDSFEIKLLVGGTYYPLKIKRSDEVLYREAARRINDKLNRYRDRFPQLSDEKYYMMVSIHISMVNLKWENFNDTKPYKDKIKELSNELDSFLGAESEGL